MAKRLFDLVLAATSLVVLSPFLLVVSLLIKLDSRGAVLYRAERVGQGGRPFCMSKYRAMVPHADRLGPALTAGRDPRVTRVGRIPRRWKIDEIPHLSWPPRTMRQMGLRMAADAVMVNVSLLIVVALRGAWWVAVEGSPNAGHAIPLEYVREAYLGATWLLMPTCTIVFWSSGFCTHGRAYRGRFTALVVVRAVTVSYLIFAFAMLVLHDVLGFPRSAIVLSWFLTLALLMGRDSGSRCGGSLTRPNVASCPATRTPAGRSVLVIGGAGYIGSALTKRLLEEGYRVRVLDLLLYGDEAIAESRGHPRFELVQGDLRHVNTVVRATKGMDAVVHLGHRQGLCVRCV